MQHSIITLRSLPIHTGIITSLTWGISIYGGGGFGLGYSNNYPGYDYGYGNYYGYDPYFGNNYYGGYDPFYYNNWYSPVIFSFSFGNRWHNNYYGWNNHNHNHGYNDYGHSILFK